MTELWIDDAEALRSFCESFSKYDAIAVDTESDHFHAYQAKICLIQVATRDTAALVDPLALDEEELAPLFEALADPGLVKIFHAGRNDLVEFDRDYGVGVKNFFDTQIAAKFIGYRRQSLSWLLKEVLDVNSAGKFQRFDWTTRPIPDDAKKYAVGDVIHLFGLYDRFQEELDAQNLARANEEQSAHVAETTSHVPKPFDPEDWRRIKQGRDLDGRGRAALRELFQWRHEVCLRKNRAALHVFDNAALARVAAARPASIEELDSIPRIPPRKRRPDDEGLLKAIERASSAEIPPARAPRSHDSGERRSRDEMDRYSALRTWRNRLSDELELPGEFIATNATLTEIAASPPSSMEELEDFPDILPWQRELFGSDLLGVLSK